VRRARCEVRGATCEVRRARCDVRGARCDARGAREPLTELWGCQTHREADRIAFADKDAFAQCGERPRDTAVSVLIRSRGSNGARILDLFRRVAPLEICTDATAA
jgi:hypothetical protein